MDHDDHVALIREGVAGATTGRWADIGSGTGAFTLALADLLEPTGSIVSVDRDAGALAEQDRRLRARFPDIEVRLVEADFTQDLALGELDGLMMANALHFVTDPALVLRQLVARLRQGGRAVLVEYDAERGNPWVPHPISAARWPSLAVSAGLREARLLHRVPSRFLGSIYAAMAVKPGD